MNRIRILGIDIPSNKRGEIALSTGIFGIGLSRAQAIFKAIGLDKNKKAYQWTEEEIKKIRNFIIDSGYKIEGDLRAEISLDIKKLRDIDHYRYKRRKLNLPVRGQRTRTNARTNRGARKTVANKKKVTK